MIPESAARKLARFVQAVSDSRSLAEAARKQVAESQGRLIVLQTGGSSEQVQRGMAEVEAAQDLQEARWLRYQDAEKLATRLSSWVDQHRGVTLEAVPMPNGNGAGSPFVVVGDVRSKISTLQSEVRRIRTAPPPMDDAKAQVRALVDRLVQAGKPRLTTSGGRLDVQGWSPTHTAGPPPLPVIVGLLAWLDPARMVAALERELAAMPQDQDALPWAERASRVAAIEDELLDLEIQEEAMITAAAEAGVVIERRSDASPAAILGVRIVQPNVRAAA